jgi:hypothetical protein
MKKYSIEAEWISLEEFRKLTAGRKMLPSRVSLQEEMEERFKVLKKAGMKNLGDLRRRLGSKEKIGTFSLETGLDPHYLSLLNREAGSYLAKPFPLSDFPGIPFEYTEVLKSRGIRHTRDFFEQSQQATKRTEMSAVTGIPLYRMEELLALCDLSRITGVGGAFARMTLEAGISSTTEYAVCDTGNLRRKYLEVIRKHGHREEGVREEDLEYCITYARVIADFDDYTLSLKQSK